MYSGPHIETNGLKFGYDTGQTNENDVHASEFSPYKKNRGKHYGGRPTINYIAHQNAVRQDTYTPYSATSAGTWNAKHPNAITAINAQGSSITGYVNGGVGDYTNTYHAHWQYDPILDKPVVVMDAYDGNWKAKSYGTGMPSFGSLGMVVGSNYVISWLQYTTHLSKSPNVGVYCRNDAGSHNFWDGLSGNSTTSRNTKINTWQRVYHVYTVSASRNLSDDYASIYMYGHYFINGAGITVKIADVQLEVNTNTPTNFLPQPSNNSISVRTATKSLLDVKRNVTIDVSNVSFDSNGDMTFDGTNDSVLIGSVGGYSNQMTCESLFKTSSGATWKNILCGSTGDIIFTVNGTKLNFGSQGSNPIAHANYSTTNVNDGQWHHGVATYNGSEVKIYVDGVLESTNSRSGSQTPSSLRAGSNNAGNNEFFNGYLPVVKLYNRALNAQEIERNYKAYKNRFNF